MRCALAGAALALAACHAAPRRIAAVLPFEAPAPLDEAAVLRRAPAGAAVGYLLLDAAQGRSEAEREADAPLPPASVAKLASTIAALEVLGPDHRFTTALVRKGGDLWLRGGGDPQLGFAELMALAQRLRGARGIRRFFYDDTAFPWSERIDSEQPPDAGYDPALGALSIEGNRVPIRWRPAGDGAVTAWALPWGLTPLDLAGRGSGRKFERDPGGRWLLNPELPERGDAQVPVRRPGEHAARAFASLAREAGIELPDPEPAPAPEGAELVAQHPSRPLHELARATLEHSSNFMADMLLLSTAVKLAGEPVPLAEAALHLEAFWAQRLPGETVRLENGSGLSGRSRLTARQAVGMLAYAARQAWPRPYLTLLPIAGWSGTLSRRMSTPDVALRAFAKTGSLSYAIGLAGHLFTRSGRELIFAVFVADVAARDRMRAREPASLAEAEAQDREADAWASRARRVQDELVRLWVARY